MRSTTFFPRNRYVVVDGVARSRLSDLAPRDGQFDLLDNSVDNMGNYIHAEAPFNFWKDKIENLVDGRRLPGRRAGGLGVSVEYANQHDSIFVLSAANFLQYEGMSDSRRAAYSRLLDDLSKLKVPLVVLGLGVQAPRLADSDSIQLPQEAISLMHFLADNAELVSLRGNFSAQVFQSVADCTNTVVTGCPSFFQNPTAFASLLDGFSSNGDGYVCFSITNFGKPAEAVLFRNALENQRHWIDVRYPDALKPEKNVGAPVMEQVRDAALAIGAPSIASAADTVSFDPGRHHAFPNYHDWIDFGARHIAYSYGTRLHVNMATLLAGRPAIWITHDSRTLEATDVFSLPKLTLSEALEFDFDAVPDASLYDPMFNSLTSVFDRFNDFLEEARLPLIDTPNID